MQAALHLQPRVAGRLLKKRDEPLLWMEVYKNVAAAEGFEDALLRVVEEYRIRHSLSLARGGIPSVSTFKRACKCA
jgi:hypothetical protein